MTTRLAVSIGCALLYATACTHGGQSGDDGHPIAGKPGKSGDSGAMEPDAGAGTFTAPCCFSAEGDSDVVCASNVDRDGDAGASGRALSAPYRCQGGEGNWSCACDDGMRSSYASGCTGALLEACGKVAEALDGPSGKPPASCESTILQSREGRCERDANGDYECTCKGESKPKISHASTCEVALWASCAKDCSSADGSCEPVADAPIGSYTCDCPQNHGIPRNASAVVCDFALVGGCNVVGEESNIGCNGYTGFCDREGEDYACTCLDGSEHHVSADNPQLRFEPCRRALESVCGTEGVPANKVCERSGNSYEARCIQPPDDAAPFTCNCTFHATDGDVGKLVESAEGASCEERMLDACPEVEPIDAAKRVRACTYYDRCSTRYPGFDYEACLAEAPDACVACTNAELDQSETDKDGCALERPDCVPQCSELVPKAVAVAACTAALEAEDLATAEGKCLCDMCWPDFGECIADPGCFEMLDCIRAQGCIGQACQSDPVCGPVIMRHYSTHSLGLLLQLDACPARDTCAMP